MRMRRQGNPLLNTTKVNDADFFLHGTNSEDGGPFPQIEAETPGYWPKSFQFGQLVRSDGL